jgi:hypothetical protein
MDVISFPQDLTQLDKDQLEQLEQQVNARGEELSDAEATKENVEELELISKQAEAIETERGRRDAEQADLDGRRDQASDRFRRKNEVVASDTPDDPDPENPDNPDDEEGAEAKKVKAAGESATPETPVIETIAASVGAAVTQALAAAGIASPEPKGGVRGNVMALTARQSARSKPREGGDDSFMRATSHAPHMREGTPFSTPLDVATAITNKRLGFMSAPEGTRDYLSIAHTDKFIDGEHLSQADAVENFRILSDVRVEASKGLGALVASGGGCAPYAPSYEFFRLAEPQNPVEQGTPVVQAPRGGISYIVPPSVAAAAGAIDISAQDRNFATSFVQFTSGPKACVTVTCPSTATAEVSAVSQCVTFDNLNYKVFPEQVAAFLEDVAVQFTSVKEVFYLDYINSQSTQVTGDYCYGFSRSLLYDWVTATVAYRKRHGMRRDADLVVVAPDWGLEAMKLDMSLDGYEGIDHWTDGDGAVTAALRARNITPVWYNDNPTGVTPNQKWNAAQNAGALNPWPSKLRAFIYAPGTFVRLDGGTLDVGLVRDSTLNRTNDLQLFMEEWIGMAKVGFESVSLTSTLCINGSGPAGVEPCVCA